MRVYALTEFVEVRGKMTKNWAILLMLSHFGAPIKTQNSGQAHYA
jgi:hypothetical protein